MAASLTSLATAIPWWVVGGALLAVAVMLLARWEPVKWLLRSAASLGRALSPVIVPLVVIVAYVSSYYDRPLQLVVGASAAVLLWYLWFSEGRIGHDRSGAGELIRDATAWAARGAASVAAGIRSGEAFELSRRQRDAIAAGALLVVALLIVAVALLQGPRWALQIGLVLFLVVGVLRLVGYATSRVRWAVVAFLGVLAWRAATLAGLAPGEQLFDSRAVFLVSVALPLVLVVGALGVEAANLHGRDSAPPSAGKQRVRALGFVLSFVAAFAFVFGMVDARTKTTSGTSGFDRAYHASAPVKLARAGSDQDLELAWTYAPMLRLHHDEVFLPASARDYENQADHMKCLREEAPGCSKLSCPSCADASYSHDEVKHPGGVVFYARVARGSELAAWPDDELKVMIQYWIFYDYDRWQAKTALGNLVQEHDADWEFVAVGLKSDAEPMFVALSAHCGGQLVPWDDNLAVLEGTVEKDGTVTIDRPRPGLGEDARSKRATHPLVAVALGSHGNYADDSGQRPPDWGSCLHVPMQALEPLVYAANVRDETASADDDALLVQADAIELVQPTTFPMSVAGTWGSEEIRFGYRDWPDRPGPRSPPAQRRSWHNAVRSFLCNRFWKRDSAFAEASSAACA
jgi:hypothetical protein